MGSDQGMNQAWASCCFYQTHRCLLGSARHETLQKYQSIIAMQLRMQGTPLPMAGLEAMAGLGPTIATDVVQA